MKRYKTLHKVISFLLSIVICCTAFPFTASAKNISIGKIVWYSNCARLNSSNNSDGTDSVPGGVAEYKKSDLEFFSFVTCSSVDLSEASYLTIDFTMDTFDLVSANVQVCYFDDDGKSVQLLSKFVKFSDCKNPDTQVYDISLSGEIDTSANTTIAVIFSNLTKTSLDSFADGTTLFEVLRYDIDVETEQQSFFKSIINKLTSWFDSLWEWLNSIITNIKNGFTNLTNSIRNFFSDLTDDLKSWFEDVGDWFSDLGDNIKTWFNNLIDDLSAWFEDVGDWFTEIGDRISGFFNNLWENITNKVTEINTSISDWWDDLCAWFRALFVPEDGFFDKYKDDWEQWGRAHFGLLYDCHDLLDYMLGVLNFGVYSNDLNTAITIPEISLPFLDNPVILPATSFTFGSLINSHYMIKNVYEVFQMLVTVLGFFLIFKFGLRTFNNIIGERD